MSIPRRRIIRPAVISNSPDQHQQSCIQKQCQRLEAERAALGRWMIKLRRAFHSVEKIQRGISRLERKITQLEES